MRHGSPGADILVLGSRERVEKRWIPHMWWNVVPASLAGYFGKEPCLFYEIDWGTNNNDSYCQHTVPIIHG
jgi:hypothetical protein